jgi:hypothetical protein
MCAMRSFLVARSLVVGRRLDDQRQLLQHVDALLAQRFHLGRIVGQELDLGIAEIEQDVRGKVVVARLDRGADGDIGVDRVVAPVLGVGAILLTGRSAPS